MRKKNETRRGGHLGRVPEHVCSAADTRKNRPYPLEGKEYVIIVPGKATSSGTIRISRTRNHRIVQVRST